MQTTSRITRQRIAIRDTLISAEKPLQPKEIQALASESSPKLGLATIYRNLKKLEAEGQAEVVHLPGMARCYAYPRRPGSMLLYCKESGHAEFLPLNGTQIPLPALPQDFEFDRYEVVVRGLFRGASKKTRAMAKKS